MKLMIYLLALTWPVLGTNAQSPTANNHSLAAIDTLEKKTSPPVIRQLRVGEELPDIALELIYNYTSPSARTADFRGKFLLLDFWASWCMACMEKFPLMDSIQKTFGDKLQVLLVSSNINDRFGKGKLLMDRWLKANPGFSVPSVLNDTIMKKYFPYRYMPAYVLISPEGNLLAMLSSKIISLSAIGYLLEILLPEYPTYSNNNSGAAVQN